MLSLCTLSAAVQDLQAPISALMHGQLAAHTEHLGCCHLTSPSHIVMHTRDLFAAAQDLQAQISALMHGQLAVHLEQQKQAEAQRQAELERMFDQRLAAAAAAAAGGAALDSDWGSVGEDTMS